MLQNLLGNPNAFLLFISFLFSAMTGCQSTTNEDSSQKPYIPWVQSVGLYSNELDKHLESNKSNRANKNNTLHLQNLEPKITLSRLNTKLKILEPS